MKPLPSERQPLSTLNTMAARMSVILLAVFAVLVQSAKGDSNCLDELAGEFQECQNVLTETITEVSKMSAGDARNKKICCGISKMETCVTKVSKKCDTAAGVIKDMIDRAKSSSTVDCSGYACSSGSTIAPVNAVTSFLLLYLGYFLYTNKF